MSKLSWAWPAGVFLWSKGNSSFKVCVKCQESGTHSSTTMVFPMFKKNSKEKVLPSVEMWQAQQLTTTYSWKGPSQIRGLEQTDHGDDIQCFVKLKVKRIIFSWFTFSPPTMERGKSKFVKQESNCKYYKFTKVI